jgi:hypothetical protein
MRPALDARETRALLAKAARGTDLLIWEGGLFHRVTPEAMRGALPRAEAEKLKKERQ